MPGIACRQHQYWNIISPLTPAPQYFQARTTGQAQIQDDRVEGFCVSQEFTVITAVRGINRVAGVLQENSQFLNKISIILDE